MVPVFFDGQNSRLFQIASHMSQTLREALLFHEVRNKLGAVVRVRIGAPQSYLELAGLGDRHALIAHLRRLTYALDEPGAGRRRQRFRLAGLRPRDRAARHIQARHLRPEDARSRER